MPILASGVLLLFLPGRQLLLLFTLVLHGYVARRRVHDLSLVRVDAALREDRDKKVPRITYLLH